MIIRYKNDKQIITIKRILIIIIKPGSKGNKAFWETNLAWPHFIELLRQTNERSTEISEFFYWQLDNRIHVHAYKSEFIYF